MRSPEDLTRRIIRVPIRFKRHLHCIFDQASRLPHDVEAFR